MAFAHGNDPSVPPSQSKAALMSAVVKAGLYDPHLIEGEHLVQVAEKALLQSTLFSAAVKVEDAMESYRRAAEEFRLSSLWEEAGDCYRRIAELEKTINNAHGAAIAYLQGGEMYERMNKEEAISFFENAVACFAQLGHFGQAAKYQEHIGKVQEEMREFSAAIKSFQLAADYNIAAGEHILADRCLEYVAENCAILDRYVRAAETFEALGLRALQWNMRRFNAKTYFLHAGLCALAHRDALHSKKIRRRHKRVDFMFASTAECKFLEDITKNYIDKDLNAFMDHVYNFNNVFQCTVWELTILERIKNQISAEYWEQRRREEAEKAEQERKIKERLNRRRKR